MNRSEGQWTQPELSFDVHRGLRMPNTFNPSIDKSALGVHWSANELVAHDFAGRNMSPERARIIHANVPMSSVETDTAQMIKRGFGSFPGPNKTEEDEVMVKEGAPVFVTGITKMKDIGGYENGRVRVKQRTRRFNPPREMKA